MRITQKDLEAVCKRINDVTVNPVAPECFSGWNKIYFRGSEIEGEFPIAWVNDHDKVVRGNSSFWKQWQDFVRMGYLKSIPVANTYGDSHLYLKT